MNRTAQWTYGLLGILSLAVGGRLLYTEMARNDMTDYNRKVEVIFKDETLRAKWAQMLTAVSRKYDREDSSDKCRFNEEQKVEYEASIRQGEFIPDNVKLNVEAHCHRRMLAAQQVLQDTWSLETEALGTFEDWAVTQSGIEKYHRWMKYPKDLRVRILNGERGLLLGNFWEYIL